METACLKIKFTPLLKETLKNNSKYYVEIVPEVLNIQNIDKLTWAKEVNFIEYALPMTHKIILRKQASFYNKEEKMYYSCVDLLRSSSKTNYNTSFDDISKIVSDTLILYKQPMRLLKSDDDKRKKRTVNSVISNTIRNSTRIPSDKLEIIQSLTEVKEEDTNHKDSVNINSKNETIDKAINTDDKHGIFKNFDNCKDTGWTAKHRRYRESEPKLSLSPICAIDTEALTCSLIETRLSKANKNREINNDLELMHKQSNGYQFSDILSSHFGWSPNQSSTSTLHFSTSYRSPPEIRIAQYIQRIQSELLPLNVTLNDILKKCSTLNLRHVPFGKINTSKSLKSSCNFDFKDSNRLTRETCEKLVSNRAVFTIVYND